MMRTDGLDTTDSLMTDSDLHLTSELANDKLLVSGSISIDDSTPMPRRRDTPTFDQYVGSLPLEEQRRIRAAERAYLDDRGVRLRQLETIYGDQMSGYEATPAGPGHQVINGTWDATKV